MSKKKLFEGRATRAMREAIEASRAERQAAAQAHALRWTNDLPTESNVGQYFWFKEPGAEPRIVRIIETPFLEWKLERGEHAYPVSFRVGVGESGSANLVSDYFKQCLFAGPITAPELPI